MGLKFSRDFYHAGNTMRVTASGKEESTKPKLMHGIIVVLIEIGTPNNL